MSDLEFKECGECASKSGTPLLCPSCLQNRAAITKLSRIAPDDIKIIVSTILDNWSWVDEGGGNVITWCRFCGEKQHTEWKTDKIVKEYHDVNCAVPIAQKLRGLL